MEPWKEHLLALGNVLVKKAPELTAAGQALIQNIGIDSEEKLSRELDTARRVIAEIDAALADAQVMGIDAFFRMVGKGVIEAQADLDRRSLSTSAGGTAVPTLMRIPKVNAEISFGMTATSSEGFGVLVYSSEKTRKEELQHKVSFEVVAVPMPPEVRAQVTGLPDLLVTSVLLRKEILERVQREIAALKDSTAANLVAVRTQLMGMAGDWPGTLALRDTLAWILVRRKPEAKRLLTVRVPIELGTPLFHEADAGEPLFELIRAACEAQAVREL